MYGEHQYGVVKYRQAEMHAEAAANQLARTDDAPVTEHRAPRLGRLRGAFAHVHLRGMLHLPHGLAH